MPDDDEPTPSAETAPAPAADQEPAPPQGAEQASSSVSLMITRRQKQDLRGLGFSEGEIHEMTPAEAHAHLGL